MWDFFFNGSTAGNPYGSCSVPQRSTCSAQVSQASTSEYQKQEGAGVSSSSHDINRSAAVQAGGASSDCSVPVSRSASKEKETAGSASGASPSSSASKGAKSRTSPDHNGPNLDSAGVNSSCTGPMASQNVSQRPKSYKLPGGKSGLAAFFSMQGRRLEDVVELDKRKVLGKGTFGIVYRGSVKADQSVKCAVKSMDKSRLQKLKVSEAVVRQEVELMKDCDGHENILQLLEVFESSHQYFVVLEYCDGGDLQEAFKGSVQGTLAETQVAHLMHQVLSAIAFLHTKSICHRDVKPHNLMTVGKAISQDAIVKLGDFGIAVRVSAGSLLTEQVGTPAFMSPEMHLLPKRSKGYDMLVDEWAAGVCMIYLLAHEYPFMDSQGRLLRHELVEGQVPLWAADGFSGLFRRAQEAVGLRGPGPSRLSRELVRLLLTPAKRQRIKAADALQHPWFTNPIEQAPQDNLDDMPLLNLDDFQEGVSLVEREFLKALDGLEDMPMPGIAARRCVDLTDERLLNCVVCYEPAGELCWLCARCNHSVCHKCLDKMQRTECPHCRYSPSGMEIERHVVKLARTMTSEVANLVSETEQMSISLGVEHTPTIALSEKQQSLMEICNFCQAESTATSHVCPVCCASVCYTCARAELGPGTEQKCPNCGDSEHNGPALDRYFATAEALGAAFAIGGALGAELQQDIAALATEVAKSVERHATENWQHMTDSEQIDSMATHVDSLATADLGRTAASEQEKERLDHCFICKASSSSLDHFCPQCFAAVCHKCVHNQLVSDPCCPNCGEREQTGRMIRIRVASWKAYSSAQSLWSSLLDLGSELLESADDHSTIHNTPSLETHPSAILPVPDSPWDDNVDAIDAPLSVDETAGNMDSDVDRPPAVGLRVAAVPDEREKNTTAVAVVEPHARPKIELGAESQPDKHFLWQGLPVGPVFCGPDPNHPHDPNHTKEAHEPCDAKHLLSTDEVDGAPNIDSESPQPIVGPQVNKLILSHAIEEIVQGQVSSTASGEVAAPLPTGKRENKSNVAAETFQPTVAPQVSSSVSVEANAPCSADKPYSSASDEAIDPGLPDETEEKVNIVFEQLDPSVLKVFQQLDIESLHPAIGPQASSSHESSASVEAIAPLSADDAEKASNEASETFQLTIGPPASSSACGETTAPLSLDKVEKKTNANVDIVQSVVGSHEPSSVSVEAKAPLSEDQAKERVPVNVNVESPHPVVEPQAAAVSPVRDRGNGGEATAPLSADEAKAPMSADEAKAPMSADEAKVEEKNVNVDPGSHQPVLDCGDSEDSGEAPLPKVSLPHLDEAIIQHLDKPQEKGNVKVELVEEKSNVKVELVEDIDEMSFPHLDKAIIQHLDHAIPVETEGRPFGRQKLLCNDNDGRRLRVSSQRAPRTNSAKDWLPEDSLKTSPL